MLRQRATDESQVLATDPLGLERLLERTGRLPLDRTQLGEDHPVVGHLGMIGAERPLADRQRAFVQRARRGVLAQVLEHDGQIAEARGHLGMIGAQRLLADRQRALVERTGRRVLAHGPEQVGQAVEAHGHLRMLAPDTVRRDEPLVRVGGRHADVDDGRVGA